MPLIETKMPYKRLFIRHFCFIRTFFQQKVKKELIYFEISNIIFYFVSQRFSNKKKHMMKHCTKTNFLFQCLCACVPVCLCACVPVCLCACAIVPD
jgi:hypothetical protein